MLPFLEGTKMNIVIGSSRSRDLGKVEPLISNKTVEIWSIPGGRYHQLKSSVDNHLMYHHGGSTLQTEKTHFYIVAGLCNITRKISNRQDQYTEIVYDQIPALTAENAITEIQNLKQYVL
jgi:hypothetical protein